MKILSISIVNFLSIESANIDLPDTGLLLLEGWNHDVDRSNGAGKTAILNAISFGLYDKVPRKITASEFLRRGAKAGHVEIRVSIDQTVYGIIRSRPKGVAIYKEIDGIKEPLNMTQAAWEAKLKLNYSQFIVSMYCAQGNSPRFLLMNDTDKKTFLLQLLNLEEFALCKRKVDDRIQLLNTDVLQLNNQNSILASKIEAYSESLVDEDKIKLFIIQQEQSLTAFEKALKDAQQVQAPDLSKYSKLEEDISKKKTAFIKARTSREMLKRQWDALRLKIKPFEKSDACHACGASLDNSEACALHAQENTRLTSETLKLKKEIDLIDTLLLDETKINQLSSKLKDKKNKESQTYEKSFMSQVELKSRISYLNKELKEAQIKLDGNNSLLEKLSSLKEKSMDLRSKVDSHISSLEIQKTISAIYSSTGAQAYVLDTAVNLFNEQVNTYVSALWGNMTYELLSYKETVKGDVTAKFSESIVMDGRPISIGSLSGGELKALSICTDMALIAILERQYGITMSPIIFDEAFDGLDASGKEFALELIKTLALDRLVIVIDHASEMRAVFDKVIRVEKKSGISTVTQ